MAKPSKLQQYMRERADYFESLSPYELKAYEDTIKERQQILNDVGAVKTALTAESNEFERAHASFFAVAISLIIAGMLSNQPEAGATKTSLVFYFASVVTALGTALLLFIEFGVTKRAFKRWIAHNQEVAIYTNSKRWTPDSFGKWVEKHSERVNDQTSPRFFLAEVLLLNSSLILLACWLYETLFNPSWFIF